MSFGLQSETIFAGRYKVIRLIAAGGMGAVYEVLHIPTDRRRALKVMLPHIVQSPDFRERFEREARVTAQVESDFLVDVFDAGVDEATQMPFLVMELLRGEDLGKRLARRVRLKPAEVVAHLHQAALALDKTHKASIVHRDLKPENLFLAEREDGPPRIKVLDFGIAKLIAEGTKDNATQSAGTPLYMAPEQFDGNARISAAVDIYALGMIAYSLLVGAPYWSEDLKRSGNLFAFAAVASKGPKEPASARAAAFEAALSPAFDVWFQKVTAFAPLKRYATATEAVAALADALSVPLPASSAAPVEGSSTGTMPRVAKPVFTAAAMMSTVPVETSKPAEKGRAARFGAAAVLVAVVLGGIIYYAAARPGPSSASAPTADESSGSAASPLSGPPAESSAAEVLAPAPKAELSAQPSANTELVASAPSSTPSASSASSVAAKPDTRLKPGAQTDKRSAATAAPKAPSGDPLPTPRTAR
jgi:serine/threonine-protein kinase